MIGIVKVLWWIFTSLFKSREQLEAENLERAVVGVLQRFLDGAEEIVAALGIMDFSPGSLKRIIDHAKVLSENLNDHHQAYHLICEVIKEVVRGEGWADINRH